MAEPFSTFAGALQVAEAASGIGYRIFRFIRDLKDVNVTTKELFKKLEHLGEIVENIEKLMKRSHAQSSRSLSEDEANALRTTDSLLKSCGDDIDTFTKLLNPLRSDGATSGFRRVTAQAKLDWNERYITRLEKSIQGNIMLLQTLSSCSRAVIQGDTMFQLAGSNDTIVRTQEQMLQDIARLREAFETFSCAKLQASDPKPDSIEDMDNGDAIIDRMRTAIEVTESLCDNISTRYSISEESHRSVLQQMSSNASTAEEDLDRYDSSLAHGRTNPLDTPHSSFTSSDYGLHAIMSNQIHSPTTPTTDSTTDSTTDFNDADMRLKQMISLRALPLNVMEKMLENYQSQATEYMENPTPQYHAAEMILLRSLDCGAKREQAHDVPFRERFDIGIKLAKAQLEQKKYAATETTLLSMRCLIGQDKIKLGRWSCASARLYQYWYSEVQDIKLLSKLEEFSTQSYAVASQLQSTHSTFNQNLEDSAEALIAFYTWTGDQVAVETLQEGHPSVSVPVSPVMTQESHGNSPTSPTLLPLFNGGRHATPTRHVMTTRLHPPFNLTGLNLDNATSPTVADDELLLSAARSKCPNLILCHLKTASVNCRDARQRTPLHLALIGMGGKDAVQVLLENGADVNVSDNQGSTPLHICAELDKDDIARELIRRGAKLEAGDNFGETPFRLAHRKRRLRMVECLLEAGAVVGNIARQSGSREIDFLIQEHQYHSSSPGRPVSVVGRLFRRPT